MDQRSARRLLAAALVIGVLAQALLFRTALGLNLVLMVAALVASAFLLRRPAARLDPLDAWIPLGPFAFAAFVAVRADPFLVFVDTLALRRLGSTEAVVVLVAVDLLFAAFVAFQVAYLFGGRDTLATTGFTYSEHARRGFFELLAVAFLSGGLIAGLEIVVGRRTWAYVLSAVALASLTLVVLASATLRLRLYQDAYGWTELRFYVYAAIAWLGLGAVATVGLLLAARTRWLAHALGSSP